MTHYEKVHQVIESVFILFCEGISESKAFDKRFDTFAFHSWFHTSVLKHPVNDLIHGFHKQLYSARFHTGAALSPGAYSVTSTTIGPFYC